MTKTILGAVAVLAIAVGITVPAATAAPFTPELELADAIASEYWGGPPLNCTSVDEEIVPAHALDDWGNATEAVGMATVPTQPEPCFLYVDRRLAPPDQFLEACDTVTHEDGHLHGLGHSDNPLSIMYTGADRSATPGCLRAANLLARLHELRGWFRSAPVDHQAVRRHLRMQIQRTSAEAWAPLTG